MPRRRPGHRRVLDRQDHDCESDATESAVGLSVGGAGRLGSARSMARIQKTRLLRPCGQSRLGVGLASYNQSMRNARRLEESRAVESTEDIHDAAVRLRQELTQKLMRELPPMAQTTGWSANMDRERVYAPPTPHLFCPTFLAVCA